MKNSSGFAFKWVKTSLVQLRILKFWHKADTCETSIQRPPTLEEAPATGST